MHWVNVEQPQSTDTCLLIQTGCKCVHSPLKIVELGGGKMTDNYTRSSVISTYIDGLLAEKHANGYGYTSEDLVLNRFDKYCIDHELETPEITKAFLNVWMEQTSTEGAFNQGKRISVVRQLTLFMETYGVNVYILHDFCHFTRVLPHIFDSMELREFFEVLDSYSPPFYATIGIAC
jgi:integrase/recombinase XerD